MNKIKYLLYFIVILAIVIIVIENPAFFMEKKGLVFNLKFWSYSIPAIAVGLFILGAFVIGYFLAYMNSLFVRFQSKRSVKILNGRIKAQFEELTAIKKELEFFRKNPGKKQEPSAKEEDVKADEKTAEPLAEDMKQAVAQS